MQMIDALTPVVACVQNGAKATLDDTLRARHIPRQQQDITEYIPVLVVRRAQGGDVLLRDDEHVHGRLSVDIAKRKHARGLSHDVRGNRAFDNSAKEAVCIVHGGLPGDWARIVDAGIDE